MLSPMQRSRRDFVRKLNVVRIPADRDDYGCDYCGGPVVRRGWMTRDESRAFCSLWCADDGGATTSYWPVQRGAEAAYQDYRDLVARGSSSVAPVAADDYRCDGHAEPGQYCRDCP